MNNHHPVFKSRLIRLGIYLSTSLLPLSGLHSEHPSFWNENNESHFFSFEDTEPGPSSPEASNDRQYHIPGAYQYQPEEESKPEGISTGSVKAITIGKTEKRTGKSVAQTEPTTPAATPVTLPEFNPAISPSTPATTVIQEPTSPTVTPTPVPSPLPSSRLVRPTERQIEPPATPAPAPLTPPPPATPIIVPPPSTTPAAPTLVPPIGLPGEAPPVLAPQSVLNIEAAQEAAQGKERIEANAVAEAAEETEKTILINFNNVSIIEFIRFISRISNKNFVFDENELQFNVTIISEYPTSIENIMTALLQVLRIHDLAMLEQGNNIIIHKNPRVNGISKVVAEGLPISKHRDAEIITQVFRLNTVEAEKAAAILKPLVTETSLVEVLKETNNLIVTDLASNVAKMGQLLKSIDSPVSGMVIGQYVVKKGFAEALIQLTQKIMGPIISDQSLTFVSHEAANSIFIVSTPYLVERAIAVMQYVDQTQGTTHILSPQEMRFKGAGLDGRWELDENGNWRYRTLLKDANPPKGRWILDENGNWKFIPGAEDGGRTPDGQWVLDPSGIWMFQLAPGKPIAPERIARPGQLSQELPVGHIQRTQFYIYKLNYRLAFRVEESVRRMAESLKQLGASNADVISAINSIQAIEESNSLIFTGTGPAIAKVKELIEEVDTPLRQVFLEMLILETTLDDSLNFGVDMGARFGGGDWAGSEAFLSDPFTPNNPLPAALDTTGIGLTPSANLLARTRGFNLGIIGQHLTFCGQRFNSLGLLIKAIRDENRIEVIQTPRILTEDNSPAEIFVGENIPYPTQAISNDFGTVLTQNFDYRDVGTRLKVTPLIGNDDFITLDIEEEVSRLVPTQNVTPLSSTGGIVPPTTRKNKTTTKVHMPNNFFLVMSGMMQSQNTLIKVHIPCLGGLPIVGAAFSERNHNIAKRNLLIFIRPQLIDTELEMQNLTKHHQDIWKMKNYEKKTWKYEAQEALEFLNIREETCPVYEINPDYRWGHFE